MVAQKTVKQRILRKNEIIPKKKKRTKEFSVWGDHVGTWAEAPARAPVEAPAETRLGFAFGKFFPGGGSVCFCFFRALNLRLCFVSWVSGQGALATAFSVVSGIFARDVC